MPVLNASGGDIERYCTYCGRANPATGRYCGNCGQVLTMGGVLLQQPETESEEATVRRVPPTVTESRSSTAQAPPSATATARKIASAAAASTRAGDPAILAVLSFIVPGVGQILNRQAAKGVAILIGAFIASAYLHVGTFTAIFLIARALFALDAYRIAEWRQRGDAINEWDWDLRLQVKKPLL